MYTYNFILPVIDNQLLSIAPLGLAGNFYNY